MVQRLSEPLIYEQNRKSSKYSSKIKNFKKKGKEDMKKMKKILAMALAMAMVLGMSVTTFAATPHEGDTTTVKIRKKLFKKVDKRMSYFNF